MFTLVHLDTPPPESLKAQVLQMVVDYLSDLSPVSLTPSNALYPLYQYVVGFEVHRYLERMDDAQPGQPKLLLALDAEDPSQVLGFALYLTYLDDPQASALLYLAVRTRQRKRGMGGALVAEMIARHPHAQVACVASKAPFFEALGFHVLHAHGPQVVLNTRRAASQGTLAVQDLQPIFQSTEVRQIYSYQLKRHGRHAMGDAERQRDRLLDQLARQAQAYVDERPPPRLH